MPSPGPASFLSGSTLLPSTHLPLDAAVFLGAFDEVGPSLEVFVKLPQGHVPFLHQDMRHVGLYRDETSA